MKKYETFKVLNTMWLKPANSNIFDGIVLVQRQDTLSTHEIKFMIR